MPVDRYQSTTLLSTGRGRVHGLWKPPTPSTSYERLQVVTGGELGKHDVLTGRAYSTREEDLWWLLSYHNKLDPFTLEVGDKIRVPDVNLEWDEAIPESPSRPKNTVVPRILVNLIRDGISDEVRRQLNKDVYIPPVHQRPETSGELIVVETANTISTFSYAIEIPNLTGPLHFQVQASEDTDFSGISLNGFSLSNPDRWFYFDPNSGSGGAHLPMPSSGLNGSQLTGNPVYFKFLESDGLSEEVQYYIRWRVWNDGQESQWNSSPPIYLT